jgi:hypothetical protein
MYLHAIIFHGQALQFQERFSRAAWLAVPHANRFTKHQFDKLVGFIGRGCFTDELTPAQYCHPAA